MHTGLEASVTSLCTQNTVIPVDPPRRAPFRSLPLLDYRVRAGFPSPANDYFDTDLHEHMLQRPAATFLCVPRATTSITVIY